MSYKELLTEIIIYRKIPIVHGKAIIIIWKNEQHLEEWVKAEIAASDDIRIATLPLNQIRLFRIKEEDEDKVCVIALAFGIEENYSDTNCIYHMTVKNNH